MTSTAAGLEVRRRYREYFRERGVEDKLALGHFGTLDPLAEGVLPLALGRATRLFPLITDARKRYTCVLVLGCSTTTGDIAGELLREAAVPADALARLLAVIPQFLGDSTQIPPMTSALHHDGRRLYELAREGITVERAPRAIRIDALDISEEIDAVGMTAIRLRVTCSEGTYIRVLCEDLAKAVGTEGHMLSLVREAAGPFSLDTAIDMDAIDRDPEAGLLDPRKVLPFATLTLHGEALVRFRHGQTRLLKGSLLDAAGLDPEDASERFVFVTDREDAHAIAGIALLAATRLTPHSVFP